MTDAKPFPKSQQLARGERRYRRKVASPKQWQAIYAAKRGPCRVCEARATDLHHVIARGRGGDDVADNLVPVCRDCHRAITLRMGEPCHALADSLTDAEYAYCVTKFGESILERVYGITYTR